MEKGFSFRNLVHRNSTVKTVDERLLLDLNRCPCPKFLRVGNFKVVHHLSKVIHY